MIISQIEVGNFRKLHAARIDLSQEKTVFVGANTSGKTSAMTVLRRFLVEPREFAVTDFTLSNWSQINAFGAAWENGDDHPAPTVTTVVAKKSHGGSKAAETETIPTFADLLPHIDVWLDVADGEMHYVRPLIPSLDWESGLLGVRLRYEPADLQIIRNDYCALRKKNSETIARASGGGEQVQVALWPETLMNFLERRIGRYFRVKPYLLDPAKLLIQ